MRKTKIIATLGLVSESLEMQKKLIESGVDVFRLNLSHNKREWHLRMINQIYSISDKVEILIDTRGPEIRLGDFEGVVEIKTDDIFTLTTDINIINVNNKILPVTFGKFSSTVKMGDLIALDGGMLFGEVVDLKSNKVICQAKSDWRLSSRRHINLPGERIDLPTLSESDRDDLQFFANDTRVNYVAVSFTRFPDDMSMVKQLCPGKKVIAKIENFEGVENFIQILSEADGIMVARGDLGVETPLEQLPVLQRYLVRESKKTGKLVVVATEMLESMVKSPRPTRAEVSDIATAVWENADFTMLSEEVAAGQYPIECVDIMRKVIEYTEQST